MTAASLQRPYSVPASRLKPQDQPRFPVRLHPSLGPSPRRVQHHRFPFSLMARPSANTRPDVIDLTGTSDSSDSDPSPESEHDIACTGFKREIGLSESHSAVLEADGLVYAGFNIPTVPAKREVIIISDDEQSPVPPKVSVYNWLGCGPGGFRSSFDYRNRSYPQRRVLQGSPAPATEKEVPDVETESWALRQRQKASLFDPQQASLRVLQTQAEIQREIECEEEENYVAALSALNLDYQPNVISLLNRHFHIAHGYMPSGQVLLTPRGSSWM